MPGHPDPENVPVTGTEVYGKGGPLRSAEIPELRIKYGHNSVVTEKRIPCYMLLLQALLHPFNILLAVIAISSAVADEIATTLIISVMIVISTSIRFYQELKTEGAVHGLLKLITKSVAVIRYDSLDPEPKEMMVPSEELVPGDWVVLRPGELVPADGIVIKSKVFFVSQSALTGEAIPVEKYEIPREDFVESQSEGRRESDVIQTRRMSLDHRPMSKVRRFFRMIFGLKVTTDSQLDQQGFQLKEDLTSTEHVFMGTQIITGMATVRIIRTGSNTLFGRMAEALSKAQPTNPFQQGVKRISWIFFVTMAVMVPPVFLVHGLFHFNWRDAFIFSLSVAVGLTPEMLPMIVNANLAKGSLEMTKRSSIIKKLDAIINLGAVDVLCTDKTGTLTRSIVQLKSHLNPYGGICFIPLQIGFLNSYFQSVLQNPLDSAVTSYYGNLGQSDSRTAANDLLHCDDAGCMNKINSVPSTSSTAFVNRFSRIDELPFDFTRRRISVILKESPREGVDYHAPHNIFLVCKGAVEETLKVCTKVIPKDIQSSADEVFPSTSSVIPLTEDVLDSVMHRYNTYTHEGQRVLAVAYKPMPSDMTAAKSADESDLIFVGFLAFVDPPKETTKDAIINILRHNIQIKVLTGDAPNICHSVCKEIHLPVNAIITGDDLQKAIEAGTLAQVVESGTIFAKLTPLQKSLVVHSLKEQNHVVAFLGDGINDAPALKEADVGISVDNGVDICRESADVILLDKDLQIVVDGIRIGRKTYGNTLKYITMAVSSNFGNVFSVLVASAWLPFEPMRSLHLLTQNLLYDCSQIGIPWDTVDEEFLLVPHKWKMKSILRFMLWMGPWSSVFDISTFAFMYYYYDIKDRSDEDKVKLFQTTWFTVGLLTQTLIVHMIRTAKIPIIQSRASWTLTLLTLIIMGIGLALPHIPGLNDKLGLYHDLPIEVYYFTAAVLAAYCVTANIAKLIYVAIFKEWF